MKTMMNVITILLGIATLFLLCYLGWTIGRKINYEFSYKEMVKSTVKEMVKEECLKK